MTQEKPDKESENMQMMALSVRTTSASWETFALPRKTVVACGNLLVLTMPGSPSAPWYQKTTVVARHLTVLMSAFPAETMAACSASVRLC